MYLLTIDNTMAALWPDDTRSQGISSHVIDILLEYNSLSTGKINPYRAGTELTRFN